MIADEDDRLASEIDSEFSVVDVEEIVPASGLGLQHSGAGGDIRTESSAMLAAHGNAENAVEHCRDDMRPAVQIETVVACEEFRVNEKSPSKPNTPAPIQPIAAP